MMVMACGSIDQYKKVYFEFIAKNRKKRQDLIFLDSLMIDDF